MSVSSDDDALDDCNVGQPRFCLVRADYFNSVSSLVDPAGNRTEIHYDTSSRKHQYFAGNSAGPQDTAYFGRPIKELYYSVADDGSRKLVKKVEKTWSQSYIDDPESSGTLCTGVGYAVLVSEKTTYLDDTVGGTTTKVVKSFEDWVTWDGSGYYGRFETTVLSGNGIGEWEKVAHTDYANDNEFSPDNACSASQQLIDGWLPGVVASEWVGTRPAGGGTTTLETLTQHAYDTTTGRVQASVARLDPENVTIDACANTLGAIGEQSGDIVTLVEYNEAGNVSHQGVRFGGVTEEAFGTDLTWQFGVQATKKNVALSYYDSIATVDPDTSLVTKEEIFGTQAGDPLAVSKTYGYDALQRPVTEQVGDLAATHYEYQTESLPDGRQRLKAIRTWRGTGDDLAETIGHHDFAGRVTKKEKLNPDGSRSYQHVRYDEKGRESFVSEWTSSATDDGSLPGTTKDYTYITNIDGTDYVVDDPFGRVRKATGPLGEVTETDYFGTNKTVTVRGIATGQQTEQAQDAVTTYYTDGLGRLVAVDSAEGADAVYEYDVNDNLTKVNLVDALSMAPTANDRYATSNADEQVRSFAYDALGRQTSATQPENGTSETLAWNELGQVTETRDALGTAWGHKTVLTYDAAGRPTRIERQAGSDFTASYAPGDSTWTASGWSTTDSTSCLGEGAWYIGGADCHYAQAGQQVATLDSPQIGGVPNGAVLTFRIWRQVRQTAKDVGTVDSFRVLARKATTDPWPAGATELYAVDSSQISWSRWRQSLALRIPVEELAGDPAANTVDLELRFEFDSTDTNDNATVKGIGIGPIDVKRSQSVMLSQIAYDEDHSDRSVSETNRPRGKPTTVTTYDEATGAVIHVRSLR
ncbi:MAG: hypothetical protein Q9Q40_11175 [Acidobacteriota bacterium]|nr:hypothetical protein [Acidobacteriota bacterium]